jgi:hypothetical protein
MKTLIAAGLAASVLASGAAASAEPVVVEHFHHGVPHGVVMMVPPAGPVIHHRIVYGPVYPAPGYVGGYRYGYGYGYDHGYGWRYRDHDFRRDHDGWRDHGRPEWRDHGGDHGDHGDRRG